MSIVKNAIINLSKSCFSRNTYNQKPLGPNVSRVFHTSVSTHLQARNAAAGDGRDKQEYSPYNADEVVQEPEDSSSGPSKTMSDGTNEMVDSTKEKTGDMKDKAKGKLGHMADAAKEYTHETKEKMKRAGETVMDTVDSVGESAKQKVKGAWGTAKETVVGTSSSDSDVEDFIENHVRKPARENKEKVLDDVGLVDKERRRQEEQDQNKH